MSGSKRKSQYRKSVTTNYLHTNTTLEEGEDIAKIICSRGANLFEVEVSEDEKNGLGLLPNKFRNLIWIKRNDFVIVTKTSESDNAEVIVDCTPRSTSDGQSPLTRYEIKQILNAENIKNLRISNQWPIKFKDVSSGTGVKAFESISYPEEDMDNESEDFEEEEETDKFGNTIFKNLPEDNDEQNEIQTDNKTKNMETACEIVDSTVSENVPVQVEVAEVIPTEHSFEIDERDEYEEESEDGRNVEYAYDSHEDDDDLCCMNAHPTPEDVTCSLCSVTK